MIFRSTSTSSSEETPATHITRHVANGSGRKSRQVAGLLSEQDVKGCGWLRSATRVKLLLFLCTASAAAIATQMYVLMDEHGTHCTEHLIGTGSATVGSFLILGSYAFFLHLQRRKQDQSSLVSDVERFLTVSVVASIALSHFSLAWITQNCQETSVYNTFQDYLSCALVVVMRVLANWYYVGTLMKRIRLTEKSFGEELGSRKLRILRYVLTIPKAIYGSALLVARLATSLDNHHFIHGSWLIVLQFDRFLTMSVYVMVAVVTWKSLGPPLVVTQRAMNFSGVYTQAEAAWSHKILSSLRYHMCMPAVLAVFFDFLLFGVSHFFGNRFNDFLMAPLFVLITLVEVAGILQVLGLFQEQRPSQVLALTDPVHKVADEVGRGDAWARTVQKVGSRSVTVGELIKFHALLHSGPECMPHYDPWASTTNDVVRQAIIPLSRVGEGGVAMATSLPNRTAELAQCMVTHTWSSLFVDLVGAVVAEALQLDDYSFIVTTLAQGGHFDIECDLEDKGVLDRTYWICAFCINQHSGICGGFPLEPEDIDSKEHRKWDFGRRDTVSGEIFKVCDCQEPKLFNDSPDECELNKFDHVMAFLNESVPGLTQLVAVDRDFKVFSRVWCVAELVQAHLSHIPQHVELPSCDGLNDDAEDLDLYVRLSMLTVAKAEATRPEDKDAILGRISCVREFDAQLQMVIFGDRGLLSRSFVGFGVVEAAANTARRLKFLARRRKTLAFQQCFSFSDLVGGEQSSENSFEEDDSSSAGADDEFGIKCLGHVGSGTDDDGCCGHSRDGTDYSI